MVTTKSHNKAKAWSYSYLHKDREEDNSDDGSEEHFSHGKPTIVQQEAEGEGNGASQATIGYNELILGGQLDNAEIVDDVGQANHSYEGHNEKFVLCVRRCYKADYFQTLKM